MAKTPTFFEQAEAYRTPEGKVDVPYVYAFDASGLTDGLDYKNLSVVIDHNSEFILRRVMGLNLCVNSNATGKFRCHQQNQLQMQQSPIRPGLMLDGATLSGTLPVLPEAIYQPASAIPFELYGVLRNATADTVPIYNSFLAFCGVRRFDAGDIYTHKTSYPYRELPYTYTYPLALNWSHWTGASNGVPTNPHVFTIPIYEDDFELCAIGVTKSDGTAVTTNDFQISLWSADKAQQFSSLPLNLPYVNWNGPKTTASLMGVTVTMQPYGRPVYPVPPIVYPIRGILQFSITSMLPYGTTGRYTLHFMGIKRKENHQ
jgi:hypothetical protein